jgi:hypothetical protein
MEEILASIRKIISEDEPDGSESGEPESGETAAIPDTVAESAEGDDVLELTERIEEEEDSVSDTNPELAEEVSIDSILAGDEQDSTVASPPKDSDSELVSGKTKSGVTSAMSQFAGALATEKSQAEASLGGGPTLDALVLAVLEPQLKTWLDENLEPLVERLVKEELKRMARRAEDI